MARKKASLKKPAQEHSYDVASLVLGIVSIFLPVIGIVPGILAIVFWNKQKKIGPSGLATAGFICGVIGLVWQVIIILYIILIIVFLASLASTLPATVR